MAKLVEDTAALATAVQNKIITPTDGVELKCGCGAGLSSELITEIGSAVESVLNDQEDVEMAQMGTPEPAIMKGVEAAKPDLAKPAEVVAAAAGSSEIDALLATATVTLKSANVEDKSITDFIDALVESKGITNAESHKTVLISLKAAGNLVAVQNYIALLTEGADVKSAGVQKVERKVVHAARVATVGAGQVDMKKAAEIAAEISGNFNE